MRILNKQAILDVYGHEDAIADCLQAYSVISDKKVISPVRSSLKTPNQTALFMPAAIQENGNTDLAVKILSVVPENRSRGLPLIVGKVCLFDEVTGAMEALLDGFIVTFLRTGAVAGASAKLLHPKPVENVVIFGCGAQGRAGLDSILYAHPEVNKVSCFDYHPEGAKRYAEEYQAKLQHIQFDCGSSVEAAVREADIIHCASTSTTPLFEAEWVKDGAHISAIGAYTLTMHELPKELFQRDNVRLFIDEIEAIREEAGDLMHAVETGFLKEEDMIELGKVPLGIAEGRQNDKQITVVKAVGVAAQDVVASKTILRLAQEKNVGVEVDM